MTISNDANSPVRFKGRDYQPLVMEDIGLLVEAIPKRLLPDQFKPFVSVGDAMKFGRSPFGLLILMRIVGEKSGLPMDGLAAADQLRLAGALTDRFYGFDAVQAALAEDDGDEDKEPSLPLAGSSSTTASSPA
ncbi:MAG: hypothetical protein ACPGVG_05645 [Mycobacterium sp.]